MCVSKGFRKSSFAARRCALVVAAVLVCAAPGLAADFHVDGGSSSCADSGPGSAAQPWCTLEHATESLVAGDTAWIHGGVYNEQLHTAESGSANGGYIVFAAYPGERPVIDGTGVDTGNNGIIVAHDYVKLLGLEVSNWNDNGIWVEGAAFTEISDCVVHDVTYGIGFFDGAHDFVLNRVEMYAFDLYGFDVSYESVPCYNGVLNDCVAHSARDPQQNVDGFALGHGDQHDFVLNRCVAYDVYDGFDISAASSTLNRCAAHSCWNGCYKLWADDVTLVNCLGWGGGTTIVELDWDGTPGGTFLRNCTFMDSGLFTIWVENAGDSLHMSNCILAGGDNIGLAFEQMGVDNYVGDHNVFHNNNADRAIVVGYEDEFTLSQVAAGAWTAYSGQDSSSVVETSAAALFVDPVGYDLHLLADAVAVDAGSAADAPSEDYDGVPRPQGAGYDIGAYEYASGLLFAMFSWSPTVPAAGEQVLFTDRSSGSPISWSWDFGDGGSSSEQNPGHTYDEAGVYQVELTVSDGQQTASSSERLTVRRPDEAPPITDPGDYVYVVDASAKVAGAAGTNWLTDIVIHNASTSEVTAYLYFLERGMNNRDAAGATVVVPADSSLKNEDVVASVFGRSNTAGAIVVGSDDPLIVTSRTYNDQATLGTYGQFIPSFSADHAAGRGRAVRMVQLISNNEFRTNIGFVNFSDLDITVAVELFDGGGTSLGAIPFELSPFEYYQENDVIGGLTSSVIDDAFAVVDCDTDGALYFTYASVIDNRSGDPVFISATKEPR